MNTEFHLEPTYGKQSVPVFKIRKQDKGKHDIVDMLVRIMLEGEISKSWLKGDNSQIVPTETQKNTCYALALTTDFTSCEDYGLALGRDMLSRHAHLAKVTIDIDEHVWQRHHVAGKPHNHVFLGSREPIVRTCRLVLQRGEPAQVRSGVRLWVMKTTQSGFLGYIKDKYTNLQPVGTGVAVPDRIMCTDMIAWWEYATTALPEGAFVNNNNAILTLLLDTFSGDPDSGVFSKSLQETAYNMATHVLAQHSNVERVHLETPNVHFYTYPLEQFGLENKNVVFQSTDSRTTASGRIVTTVSRKPSNAKL